MTREDFIRELIYAAIVGIALAAVVAGAGL
jgi:hypothetical protein